MDCVAPLKTVTISERRKIKENWITPGILKSIAKQKLLYKNTLKSRKDQHLHEKYKEYRNKLKQIMRKRKEDYYTQKCTEYRSNSKKLWRLINKLTNKEHDKTNLIECLKIDNIMDYNSKHITEEFGKYFANIGREPTNTVTKPIHTTDTYIKNILPNPKSMFLRPTTQQEIEKLIDKLENKSSSGHDDISNRLLKKLKTSISAPLQTIFNKSLMTGVFPDLMKKGDVVPLYKAREKYLTTNYTPISLLTTISKILEKIMYTRTYTFLTECNQLYKGQYGFRSHHSTENATVLVN